MDESKARRYILVATLVDSQEISQARSEMRALLLPGQRRIHFSKESHARRQSILRTITKLDLRAWVYVTDSKPSQVNARRRCFERLIPDLIQGGAQELVIERDTSMLGHDRQVLSSSTNAAGVTGTFRYRWLQAHEDAMLWTPDALAWCCAAGGSWRAWLPMKTTVTEV